MKVDSIDAAVEMAKENPHLEHGTVDVAEAMEMEMEDEQLDPVGCPTLSDPQ